MGEEIHLIRKGKIIDSKGGTKVMEQEDQVGRGRKSEMKDGILEEIAKIKGHLSSSIET